MSTGKHLNDEYPEFLKVNVSQILVLVSEKSLSINWISAFFD